MPASDAALVAPVKFLVRAEMVARALRAHGVPLDALTARILRRVADAIEKEG